MSHSKYRNRTTLALFALLLLMLATILITHFKPTTIKPGTHQPVSQILVQRPSHPDIALNLENGSWMIVEPVKLMANKQRVEPLLSLTGLPSDGYETSEVDMQASGLLAPVATVVLGQQSIAIGNRDISGERRYALLNDKVVFVPDWVLSLVNGGITALADLHIMPGGAGETLQLISGDGTVTHTQYDSWAALSAQQIVLLPMDTSTPALQQFELRDTGDQKLAGITVYDDFVQFQTQANFAFLLAPDALADLLPGIKGAH